MELLLWRWSTAVQVASAVMIAVFFFALARSDSRAELRWWVRAWLFNLAAMTVTVGFWYFQPEDPGRWFPFVRAAYLSTKTLYVVLLLEGAWALLRPGATLFAWRVRLAAFATLFTIGIVMPASVPMVGVIQSSIIATLLTAGGIFLARQDDKGVTFLAAGFAVRAALAYAETGAYLSQLTPIFPADWADATGAFLSAASSFDTGAEWMIALGCVLAVAQRTQAELRRTTIDCWRHRTICAGWSITIR